VWHDHTSIQSQSGIISLQLIFKRACYPSDTERAVEVHLGQGIETERGSRSKPEDRKIGLSEVGRQNTYVGRKMNIKLIIVNVMRVIGFVVGIILLIPGAILTLMSLLTIAPLWLFGIPLCLLGIGILRMSIKIASNKTKEAIASSAAEPAQPHR
jgi:hypothetical protein